MKVYCVFSFESPRSGDSNENIQHTIFNIKKKITLNYPKYTAMGFCSKGLKNEFETAGVNKPSVFEPLKFYCIYIEDLTRTVLLYEIAKRTFGEVHEILNEMTTSVRFSPIIRPFKIGTFFAFKIISIRKRITWTMSITLHVCAKVLYYSCGRRIFMTRHYPRNTSDVI